MREKQEIAVLTEQKEKGQIRWSGALLQAVSAMGIAAGMTGCFFAAGGVTAPPVPVLGAVLAAVLIAGLGLAADGRIYGTLLCGLAAVALFFSSGPSVSRGIYMWIDHLLGAFDQVFSTFYEGIAVPGYRPADMHLAGLVFALLAATAVSELVQRKRLAFLSAVAFLPMCVCMLLSIRLPVWAWACLTAGWVGAWCSVSGPARIRWETFALTVGAGVFLLSASLSSGTLWQEIAWRSKRSMEQGIERLRFGEDTLPKGDLTRAYGMLGGEEERLELEMEEASTLYLRGFVGSVYEGDRWRYFSSDVYRGEYRGMLSWLAQQTFCPGAQYGSYQDLLQEEGGPKKTAVSVRNVGADRRYLYLPETVASYSDDRGAFRQDRSFYASGWSGKKDYAFTYYQAQENAEAQTFARIPAQGSEQSVAAAERFEQAEAVYRAFVHENYLEIGDEEKALIHRLFFQQDGPKKTEGLYPVTSRIRAVLRLLAGYEEAPARLPTGKDFLQWFLLEEKAGNAAYHATAAVLAYRAAGIPARYVEGYVLTRQQAEQAKEDTVILAGKNAHAWVEVYVDGVGWRTVEVTPGFYEEIYQADVIVAVPDESLEGAGGETAGILTIEAYEPPAPEAEEGERMQTGGRGGRLLSGSLLFSLAVLLLTGICPLSRQLVLEWRYRRMDDTEKMFYLYGRIIEKMGKLYKGFAIDQPLKLLREPETVEQPLFDQALYVRTVKRMEKVIYGQMEPAAREILSAEALDRQLEKALRERRRSSMSIGRKKKGSMKEKRR